MVAGKTEVATDPSSKEAQRMVASNGSVTLPQPASGYTMRYAFISQRGFYPDSPDKSNQDAALAEENLGGNSGMHLFGVFDGHGEMGTECARFVQDKLPANVCSDPALLVASPADALTAAMLSTNSQLHAAPIDDSLSGTTACSMVVAGRKLYVANVGDSRAVLAERSERQGEGLVACELSMDQTPFRPDECLRVLKAGARVLTLDQLEGLKDPGMACWTNEADCDGDPPRLWSPMGMYPGTAFTRSIGDQAAESIGVVADPEVTITQLSPAHQFVVLASDGVWEFITSQQAVDMVALFDNPYDAAKALVAQAYKLWLQKETRTDDITAVVLFLDWQQDNEQHPQKQQQQAPLRQHELVRTPSKNEQASSVAVNAVAGL